MMKYLFIILMSIGFVNTTKGQETIRELFIKEINAQEGTWIANNANIPGMVWTNTL